MMRKRGLHLFLYLYNLGNMYMQTQAYGLRGGAAGAGLCKGCWLVQLLPIDRPGSGFRPPTYPRRTFGNARDLSSCWHGGESPWDGTPPCQPAVACADIVLVFDLC